MAAKKKKAAKKRTNTGFRRRPTTFTDERKQKCLDLIATGVPDKHAAAAAGVSKATFYRHIEIDDKGKTGTYYDKEFAGAVEEARGKAVSEKVLRVSRAASESWQAAAWWLERRYPQYFALINRTKHVGSDGGAIKHEHRITYD
jgi:hypothetical protein